MCDMVTFPQFANEPTFFWYAAIFRLGHRTRQTIVLVWGNGMQQIISSKQRTEQKQTSTYTNHLCKKQLNSKTACSCVPMNDDEVPTPHVAIQIRIMHMPPKSRLMTLPH